MFPKAEPQNRTLLDLARGKPCLLQIPYVCNRNPDTTVAAHSNALADGKGKGIKAHSERTVWACGACHYWFDFGPAPKAKKAEWFVDALERQLGEWQAIAADPKSRSRDREAARWALERHGLGAVA